MAAEEGGYGGSALVRKDSDSSFRSSRLGVFEDLLLDAGLQESALLRLAERQAGREGELAAAQRKVAELELEVGDLQKEVELRQVQEDHLKEVRPGTFNSLSNRYKGRN